MSNSNQIKRITQHTKFSCYFAFFFVRSFCRHIYDLREKDISLNSLGNLFSTSAITRFIWRLVHMLQGRGQWPFNTSGAIRLMSLPFLSHGPLSNTQLTCCCMYRSFLNFRLIASSVPTHAIVSPMTLNLVLAPGLGFSLLCSCGLALG